MMTCIPDAPWSSSQRSRPASRQQFRHAPRFDDEQLGPDTPRSACEPRTAPATNDRGRWGATVGVRFGPFSLALDVSIEIEPLDLTWAKLTLDGRRNALDTSAPTSAAHFLVCAIITLIAAALMRERAR